ncbi:MAG: nicotinate phosphoribosyltransferase, partial [Acidimicrobiia bacterium]
FDKGERVDGTPDLEELRRRRQHDLDRLDTGVRRLVNPHIYHVSLTRKMKDLQRRLVEELTNGNAG